MVACSCDVSNKNIDEKALFKYSTNATSEGSWYFILDESWPFYLAEQDCEKRLAMKKFESRFVFPSNLLTPSLSVSALGSPSVY